MKAIDETWRVDTVFPQRIERIDGCNVIIGKMFEDRFREEGIDKERAQISACAPEALRMLLAMEHDNSELELCRWCNCCLNDSLPEDYDGHTSFCPWFALMKKAGLK